MAAQIKFKEESIKKYSLPYELFPTETGTAKPQILHLYKDKLYIKYNIDAEFKTLDEEGEVADGSFTLNKAITVSRNQIAEIGIEEHRLLQLDSNNNPVEFDRPGITILSNIGGYTLWFEDFDKAVEVYNDLINWL